MAESFDAYYKWLGIPPQEQPPNHYRLLGLVLFESDADVIEAAADRQMSHLRSYQIGRHSAQSQRLLNECAAARVTLLDPKKKADYDRQLREKLAIVRTPPLSVGNTLPAVPPVEGRGEGVSPHAKPLPQPQPAAASSPFIDVGASTPVSRLSARGRKREMAWLIPTAGVSGVVVLALVMWIALRPSGPADMKNRQTKTAGTSSAKTSVANSSRKQAATAPVNEAAPAPPTPPASSDSPLADTSPPGGSISTSVDDADSRDRDDGKYLDLVLAPGVSMRLVKIPASTDGKITSFYLGRTEVTQKQWQVVMGNNPSAEKGDELPITRMAYNDCLSFCDKLNRGDSGRLFTFRIPSEEELHYACFLGMSVDEAFPGDIANYAWFNSTAANRPHAVAQKKPNRLGIYDLLGNVWEWTSDETYLFGGSFDVPDWWCRNERLVSPDGRKAPAGYLNFGIRIAADRP
ncbi:MAG TPA: SUMF1/EgtB/PvdO family nonheme iron enzyme [Pirellulales bacterium]|nr:SUMF1/EgtB/PvdO family nonheme iron enzyme [Pirellulales bacterium]